MKKLLSALTLAALASVVLLGQTRATPANLRVKVDAAGYLVVSSAAITNPVTTVTFANARLLVDSSGNLGITDGSGSGFAPANATYITQTPNATLTNEQALSALSSGILRAATTTGVVTSLGDVLPVANGGTSFSTYTTGDLIYASAAGTLAKLNDVATGQVLASGGVGAAPTYTANPSVATLTTSTRFIGITGCSATSAVPPYTFSGQTDDGMCSPFNDYVGFTVGGILAYDFDGTGFALKNGQALYWTTAVGSSANLMLARVNDGVLRFTTGTTTNGVRLDVSTDAKLTVTDDAGTDNAIVRTASFYAGDGAQATPSFTFNSETGTGWWRNGAGVLAGSTLGHLALQVNDNGTSPIVQVADLGLPASSPDVILHRSAAGKLRLTTGTTTVGALLDFSTDGTIKVRTDTDGADANLTALNISTSTAGSQFIGVGGTQSAPDFTSAGNLTTGIYMGSDIRFTQAGTLRMTMTAGALTVGTSSAAVAIALSTATGSGGSYMELWEQSADPGAPSANSVRMFAKDSGGGKTQLCARFNTGATQCFATEP